jgi:hypothetical protein
MIESIGFIGLESMGLAIANKLLSVRVLGSKIPRLQATTSSTWGSARRSGNAPGLLDHDENRRERFCVLSLPLFSRAFSRLPNPPASSRWWFSCCEGY